MILLYCSTFYLGAITPVPCIGTCGSGLAYIIFPTVALLVGAVLLNLVTAILINAFRYASRSKQNIGEVISTVFRFVLNGYFPLSQSLGSLTLCQPP
jgi:hypothetical protein